MDRECDTESKYQHLQKNHPMFEYVRPFRYEILFVLGYLLDQKLGYLLEKCEIAEKMHNKNYFGVGMCSFDFTGKDIDFIISKFHKVWSKIKKK